MANPVTHAVTVLAAAALLAGCGKDAPEALPVRPVLSKIVVPSAAVIVAITGTVEPQIKADISFRILGRLIARPVNIGDNVEKDQLLAAIDPTPLEPGVRSALASLSSAQGQLANASGIEDRQKTLIESGSTTKATLESAEQGRAAAQSAVIRAQSNLTKAREQLNYAKVGSDYAGVVTAIGAEVGQVVAPGQMVVTVARPDIREAVIDVADSLAGALHTGMPLQVTLQIDPRIHVEGRIREISPQADPVTRSRRVRVTLIAPPATFRLGTTVTTLIPGEAIAGVRLPQTAVLTTGGKTSVWLVDADTKSVKSRDVDAASNSDGSIDVTRGLNAGDRVVTAGVHQLKEGQKVRLEQDVAP
jgi:RND family efflux transporter MFP subunit